MSLSVSKTDLVRLRPAQTDDADELAGVFSFLNSPHASPRNVPEIIQSTQDSLAKDGNMTHLTVVAETLDPDTLQPKNIVAGGSLVKMSSGAGAPRLYRFREDGSMELFTYTQPTLEFGGMVAHKDARGLGIGMAVSAVRAIVARYFAHLFGAEHVLSDFLPPLKSIATKENAFWTDLIVEQLRRTGRLAAVKAMASRLTNTEVRTNTQLSAAIGNVISDDDRNRMIDDFWPSIINPADVTDSVETITRNVNTPTVQARKNLLAIYGGAMTQIGAFPINGGPNYVARSNEGPAVKQSKLKFDSNFGQNRAVVFPPYTRGLEAGTATPEDLRGFNAIWTPFASLEDGRIVVSKKVGRVLGLEEGADVYYYVPPRV